MTPMLKLVLVCWRKYRCALLVMWIILDVPAAISARHQSPHRLECSATLRSKRKRSSRHDATLAFQHRYCSFSIYKQTLRYKHQIMRHSYTALFNGENNQGTNAEAKSKANVSFKSKRNISKRDGKSPPNLSAVDQLLLALTSDRTSLLLGSIGILILMLNRLLSFPELPLYEASRSRIDLLGVFAAGSVLLNGLTKLDVESVQADRVVLEGVYNEGTVSWNMECELYRDLNTNKDETFKWIVEWALSSFLRCSPARTVVLLATNKNDNQQRWRPLATAGVLPLDPQLRRLIPSDKHTPILDRMLCEDSSNIKGGTVGGTEVAGATKRRGLKESYLPTLQALPGKVEFTYLPSNAQEALLLPVPSSGDNEGKSNGKNGEAAHYAVVLGGDTAKSFAPRDVAWCKEIASWIGEVY